jgi:hypothetical protein
LTQLDAINCFRHQKANQNLGPNTSDLLLFSQENVELLFSLPYYILVSSTYLPPPAQSTHTQHALANIERQRSEANEALRVAEARLQRQQHRHHPQSSSHSNAAASSSLMPPFPPPLLSSSSSSSLSLSSSSLSSLSPLSSAAPALLWASASEMSSSIHAFAQQQQAAAARQLADAEQRLRYGHAEMQSWLCRD